MRMVCVRRSGRHGEHMPAHQTESTISIFDLGLRIDGEAVVVEIPQELIGAYLVG